MYAGAIRHFETLDYQRGTNHLKILSNSAYAWRVAMPTFTVAYDTRPIEPSRGWQRALIQLGFSSGQVKNPKETAAAEHQHRSHTAMM